jgi:KaiC/GvpD/RAD55 family RecA-like ATPase
MSRRPPLALMAPEPDDEGEESFYEASYGQTQEATQRLNLPPEAFVHWPWADLDTLVGPMAPGEVHYVLAFSGRGKTTFVTSLVDALLHGGVPLSIAPLEITPDTWRIWLACFRAGVVPGDALQGHLIRAERAGDLQAAEARRAIKRELAALTDLSQPWHERLFVSDCRSLTPTLAERLCDEAADFGAKLLVVDHGDHIAESRDVMAMVTGVHKGLLRGAQRNNLAVLVTSQCNQDVTKGDGLMSYMPPQESHVKFGGIKREVCTTMLGLFRPLRGRAPGEAPRTEGTRRVDPYIEQLRAVRKRLAQAHTVLLPNVTGIDVMKHRHRGSVEGHQCHLGYEHGRNVPLSDSQRRDLEAAQHSIRTGDAG